MKKESKFSTQDINNTLDFLILLESNYKSGEALKGLWQIAKSHKLPLYTVVGPALKNLKFINAYPAKGGRVMGVKTFNLSEPLRVHATKLLKEMDRLQRENQKKHRALLKDKVKEEVKSELTKNIVNETKEISEPCKCKEEKSRFVKVGDVINSNVIKTVKVRILYEIIEILEDI